MPKPAGAEREMPGHAYVYRARVERVVDGDTLDLVVNAGFRIHYATRVRLLECWCPEVRGPERPRGLAAAAFTSRWVADAASAAGDWPLRVQTEQDDAFGRFLALVWRLSDGACLNEDLIAAGYATRTREQEG